MSECIAFKMKDAKEALDHINSNCEEMITSDETSYNYPLYTWDDGYRRLLKCKNCGALILLQSPEFHPFEEKKLFDQSYFSISSIEEAKEINKKYNCFTLEQLFNKRWLSIKNSECNWEKDYI